MVTYLRLEISLLVELAHEVVQGLLVREGLLLGLPEQVSERVAHGSHEVVGGVGVDHHSVTVVTANVGCDMKVLLVIDTARPSNLVMKECKRRIFILNFDSR